MQIFTPSIGLLAVNIEPAICTGHLLYPRGRRWKEGRVGSWTQGVGGRLSFSPQKDDIKEEKRSVTLRLQRRLSEKTQ